MSYLIESGRRLPRDFGVVGFDNIVDAALVRPALTTIAIDPHRIGEESALLLLRRIADPDGRPEKSHPAAQAHRARHLIYVRLSPKYLGRLKR